MKIENRKYKVIDYIRIPLKIAPIPVICMVLVRFFVAAIPSLLVLATASFVDTAIDVFSNGIILKIYPPLFAIIGLIGFYWIYTMLLAFVKLRLGLRMNEVLRLAVLKKRSRLAYKHIENNETWELIARIGKDPSEQIIKGFDNILNIMQYIVEITSLLLLIAAHVWWVSIAVVGISVPLFALAFKSGKVDYEAFTDSEKYRRKADYLKEVLSSRENIEERALFGYTKAMDKVWFDRYETARKIEYKADKKIFIRTKTASIITAVLSMAIALVLIVPAESGAITVGLYMSLVTAAFNLVNKMSWELSFVMKEYSKNKMYLIDFTSFSRLEEVQGSDGIPDISVQSMSFESLEFKNVHFTYPGTDRKILNGLSMRLEKGREYAFVGKNGAGKTTIIKLLTGLYDNYEGEILINGKNLKSFTQEQLKAYFSVVYQDFAKYYVTIKDNVILGNCGENHKSDKQKTLVENALASMDMIEFIKRMPKGIDTPLGKLTEDGIDLSGGQWQRVAIARSLISKAPIHILDEPTASLDPISESKVYELFGKISKGKSTIIITHRLGAARIADQILVVDDGVIAECGSHDELLQRNGIYSDMFKAQRSWYDEQGA